MWGTPGLWVSLDESVDGSNPALGSMMGCWVVRGGGGGAVRRGVTSHSVDNTWFFLHRVRISNTEVCYVRIA